MNLTTLPNYLNDKKNLTMTVLKYKLQFYYFHFLQDSYYVSNDNQLDMTMTGFKIIILLPLKLPIGK